MTSWFYRGSASIQLNEHIIFTYPNGSIVGPAKDAVVSGNLTLKLWKPTEVKGISVRLVGEATIRSDDRETTGTTLDKSVVLQGEPRELSSEEEHSFKFDFAVSSRTAPRFANSLSRGAIIHKVVATVEGAGFWGGPLIVEEPITLLPLSVEQGEGPPALDIHVEDTVPDLGTIQLSLRDPQFTISTVFLTQFVIEAAAREVVLLEATLTLAETTEVRHFAPDGVPEVDTVRQAPVERKLYRINSARPPSEGGIQPSSDSAIPLAVLKPGEPYRFRHFVRMHDAKIIQYTTPSTTISPIRISHELVFRLNFKVPQEDNQIRQLSIVRPVHIETCLCIMANLFPPPYDPHVAPPQPLEKDARPRAFFNGWGTRESEYCCCRLSFEFLKDDWHQKMAAVEASAPKDGTRAPHNYKIPVAA